MNKLEVRISRLKSMNAFRWLLKRAFYSRVRFYRDQMTSIFPACSRLSWRFRENDVWRSEIETSIFLAVIIKPFVIHLVVEKTQSKPTQWRTVNEQLMNRREEEDIKSRFKITKKKRWNNRYLELSAVPYIINILSIYSAMEEVESLSWQIWVRRKWR